MPIDSTHPVMAWLLAGDPAIRWQTLRDLGGAPAETVAAERARVATEGLGARVLALQSADGSWSGRAWNRGWNSTMHALWLLRELGLDPAGAPAQRALEAVRSGVTWKESGPEEIEHHRYFEGEVEPCINGQVAVAGAYFGQDVRGIVARLLAEQLPDGGWNCEAERGSTRGSFNTTLCVLEALLEYEQCISPDPKVAEARRRGQEYLLERRLLRRRSTGEAIAQDRKSRASFTALAFPAWWHYDTLRALDYLRRTGLPPDERTVEAVDLLAARRDAEGRWPLDVSYPGINLVELGDEVGRPSRWNTLRALRVLAWHGRA